MCNQCATSCLDEKEVEKLRACIKLDLECAAVCRATAEIMEMDGKYVDAFCQLCADICTSCAEECDKHAQMGMEHCRICADACRQCAEECIHMSALA
jgi:hypothetical protein